jgi:DNA invertase Pin-like site-specific DNA recombinase
MKRCAIYARFSTEMQRATSLEDQIRNCRKFAAQMGYEILDEHVYQDTALSGFGVEHRPAYQRLVATAVTTAPPFTVILVDDLAPVAGSRRNAQTLPTAQAPRSRARRRGGRHPDQPSDGETPDHHQRVGQ